MNHYSKNINFSTIIVLLLLFFFVDEFAFVLYNISLFQYMCANTLSLFITDEIPILNLNLNSEIPSFVEFDSNSSFLNLETNVVNLINPSHNTFELSLQMQTAEHFFVANDVDLNRFYKIRMEATNVKKNILSFYPLQTYIYTIPGESTLIFYRLENLTDVSMHSLSIYVTSPAEAVAYIKKLQCFCYEELMISPKCIIDLPILLSLDDGVLNETFNEITINYILLLKDQR